MATWRANAKLFPSCGVFSSSNSQQRYWTQESVCAPERAFDFRKSEIGPAFCFPPRERNSRQVPRAERLSHPCLGEVHSQSSGWEKSGGKKKKKKKKTTKMSHKHGSIPVGVEQFQLFSWVIWLLAAWSKCIQSHVAADVINNIRVKRKKTVSELWRQMYDLKMVVEVSPVGPNLQKWRTPRRWGRWICPCQRWPWTWQALAPLYRQIPPQNSSCSPLPLSNLEH